MRAKICISGEKIMVRAWLWCLAEVHVFEKWLNRITTSLAGIILYK